tara:strand:- start:88 stop:438 length:351 start_codon:yes stop_codon:yes gene_type:complete
MIKQIPTNSPLNNNLIAWSDIEIYSQSSNKDHCKRRVIFYQDGIFFRSHVEYLNDDNTRRCLEHGDYDFCITVAYYNFRKRCDMFPFTVNQETLAKIDKGQASIDYANEQYSRNAS